MDFHGFQLCCPQCRGPLDRAGDAELACPACNRRYPVVLGIPDLRIFPDPYIGFEEERAKVARLVERFHDHDFESFVDYYYSSTTVVPPHHARLYKRSLLAAEARTRGWLAGWEAAAGDARAASLLELGCGTAPLLVSAENYPRRIGIDIALRWLVVGKKRLQEAGLDVPLLAACAEALPLADENFDRVVADSALEHFRDQPRALAEARRVLRPGGRLFIATPNRFSIGPDPQTGVLAGSLLPKMWTDAIVRRAGGIPPIRWLLSAGGLRRLLGAAGYDEIRIFLPGVPKAARSQFSAPMRAAISVYDLARRLPVSRHVLRLVGPLLHATARRA